MSTPPPALDNRTVAMAAAAGRFAAAAQMPATACPYGGDDPRVGQLRRVWLSAYLRARPPAAGAVTYDG